MENYFLKIEEIKKEISDYYELSFSSNDEDYKFNKNLKEKLKKIVTDVDVQSDEIKELALKTLGEVSGCAEDQEIGEEIVNELLDKKIISKIQYDIFYDNLGTKRWD